MENPQSRKIKLGMFIVIGTVLLVTALYIIGEKQSLFGSTFRLHAVFNNVHGLRKGNNVRFSGIDVGTVKQVEIMNDSTVIVIMTIQDKVNRFIKKDAVATIGTDGLMGNKLINISPGNQGMPMVTMGDTLTTLYRLDADQMLRQLEQTNKNIAIITKKAAQIMGQIQDGKGALSLLINDSLLASELNKTVTNLKESSSKTTSILTTIEESIAQLNIKESGMAQLLSDTALGRNVQTIVSEFTLASNNTKELTKELKELVINIKSGQGLMGSALADSSLQIQLQKSLKNINEGTEAFNENMEALKHNILFRHYFKKRKEK